MRTIYFVCYGNICRSPYAERFATLHAERLGLEEIAFDSAGIGATPGTRCPKPGIKAAQALGVDLTPHRAKHTSQILPGGGDLVIAMDRLVFGAVAEKLGQTLDDVRGPGGSDLHLMTRYLDVGAGNPDVPDPIGGGVRAYEPVYEFLSEAVQALLESR